MLDWEDLRHFAALVQAGNLSAAARYLKVEHATVSRRITALEASLKLKLVDRRGRRLRLTIEGERIADLTKRMTNEALSIERAAEDTRTELEGEVSISAPPALSVRLLAKPLASFKTKHPRIKIRFFGEQRFASLEQREADVALRLSRPKDGNLTIVKLGDIAFRLYASKHYLTITEPNRWNFIGYDETLDTAPQQVALMRYAGKRSIHMRVSTSEMQMALASQGAGVAMLATLLAVNDPNLVLAASTQPPISRGLWMAIHSDMKNSAPIRAMTQYLKAYLIEALHGEAERVQHELKTG